MKTTLFKCNVCEYATTRKYGLTHHAKSHTTEPRHTMPVLKCEWCLYETPKRANLNRYVKSCKGNPVNPSPRCQKRKRGEEEHSPNKRQGISCEYCDYTTSDQSNMIKHKKTWHKLAKSLNIDTPGTAIETESFEPVPLIEHMDILHTILPILPSNFKSIYAENFRAIRSRFYEPMKTEEHITMSFTI